MKYDDAEHINAACEKAFPTLPTAIHSMPAEIDGDDAATRDYAVSVTFANSVLTGEQIDALAGCQPRAVVRDPSEITYKVLQTAGGLRAQFE